MSQNGDNSSKRLLLVGAGSRLTEAIARSAPAFSLESTPDVFDALADAAESGAAAVLLPTETMANHCRQIFGAFRKADPAAKLALLCPPSLEPEAIQACRDGADDYLLLPIDEDELRDVLESPTAPPMEAEPRAHVAVEKTTEDGAGILAAAGELLEAANGSLDALLQNAAQIVAKQIDARDAAVVVLDADGEPEAWGATAGLASEDASKPIIHDVELAHVLLDGERQMGWLNIGPPRAGGAYSPEDAAAVGEWGRLLAKLITTQRQATHLRHLAVTDDLSGLYNRRYFDHFLHRIILRAADERFRVTVMIFDIDNFKHYNDRYGHMVGDAIIRDVAMLMRRCTRPHDVVVRFGGDEFAVIFWDNEEPRQPNSEHPHDALVMAERFRDEMSRHAFASIGPRARGRLTISGGLASFPWDGKDADSLLGKADEALLQAKRSGKDRILLVGKEPT